MKEPKYRRLTFEEREEISRMLALGYKIREIGRELGRDNKEEEMRNRFWFQAKSLTLIPFFLYLMRG